MFWLINKDDSIHSYGLMGEEFDTEDETTRYYILDTRDLVVEAMSYSELFNAVKLLGESEFANIGIYNDAEELYFNLNYMDFSDRIGLCYSYENRLKFTYRKPYLSLSFGKNFYSIDRSQEFHNGVLDLRINNTHLISIADLSHYRSGTVFKLDLHYFFKRGSIVYVRYVLRDLDTHDNTFILTLYFDLQGKLLDAGVIGDDIKIEKKYFKGTPIEAKKVLLGGRELY